MPKMPNTAYGLILLTVLVAACARSPEAKRDHFLARGRAYLQAGDYNRALIEFRNAGSLKPNDAEVFYQSGMASLGLQDLRAAVASFRKALDVNPKHSGAQLRLSELMAATNDQSILGDAQGRLKGLMEDGANNAETVNTLALVQAKMGRSEEAIQLLEDSTTRFPGDIDNLVLLARIKLHLKDIKGAEEVLIRATTTLPKSVDAHNILAQFYIAQNRLQEAEPELRKALALDSKNAAAVTYLARLQLKVGRKSEAEAGFKALSNLPGNKSAFALFLFRDGRREDAVRELENVVRADPGERQARTYLVAAYRTLNRIRDADRVLNAALKKNPRDTQALLQRSEILIDRRELQAADADLNLVAKLNPSLVEAHYLRAQIKKLRGESLAYREELSEALRLNKTLLPVRIELAQELIAEKNAQAALDTLDGALAPQKSTIAFLIERNWALWLKGDMIEMRKEIDAGLSRQRNQEFLLQDGLWKIRAGNAPAARAPLQEAQKAAPADLRVLQAIAASYNLQGTSQAALEKVREYAAAVPNSEPIQNYLGLMYLASGDRTRARPAFMAAKAAAPQSTQADLSLAQLDYMEHHYDDGLTHAKSVLAVQPNNVTAHMWLGLLAEAKGDPRAAITHYKKVLDLDPSQAQAANNLAYLLSESDGSLDEALKNAQRAVELAPDQPAYADTMGWILYRKGIYTSAVKYLEKAAAHDRAVWKYHLAMAYAKAGDRQHSRTTLQAALRLNPNAPEAKLAQDIVGASH